MITYELHAVHEVLEYLQGQEEKHFADIKDKTLYPEINMNWELYKDLSELDLCKAILMKDDDKIIGYSCYTLTGDLNNKKGIIACATAIFIEREYRGRLIIDFIKQCDTILLGINVSKVLHNNSDIRIGRILEKAGYNPRSISYIKTLTE